MDFDMVREMEDAGIDAFDFSLMDEDERREALNDAGLDPDLYLDIDLDPEYSAWESLQTAGLNLWELDLMDDDERREALEDAGLDPDDYETEPYYPVGVIDQSTDLIESEDSISESEEDDEEDYFDEDETDPSDDALTIVLNLTFEDSNDEADEDDDTMPSLSGQSIDTDIDLLDEDDTSQTLPNHSKNTDENDQQVHSSPVIFSKSNQNEKEKTYCIVQVQFPDSNTLQYFCTDLDLNLGEQVLVPARQNYSPRIARVVSIGNYGGDVKPNPLEGIRWVIRKANPDEINSFSTPVDFTNENNPSSKAHESRKEQPKKKRTWIVWAIIGIVAALFLIIPIVKNAMAASAYNEAETYIAEGDYQQALDILEPQKGSYYKDTESLICLCEAHLEYEKGQPVDAYNTLNDAPFRYQTEAQMSKINSFKATLKKEYDAYNAMLAERERAEYERKIANGVPYVGMPESRINDTSLGRASDKVRHNYQVKNGNQYLANLYDFYRNGQCIFTARCVQGVVTEVWDNRDQPISSQPSPSTSRNSSSKSTEDPYNARDYYHPDDFYYDYYDDFWDYEDAEDYWNEWND